MDRTGHGSQGREARPFEDPALALHGAPFVGLTVVALLTASLAYHGLTTELMVAWGLLGAIVAAALWLPWSRLPASLQAVPPLLLYVVMALLRDATGGGTSVFTGLALLPVVWLGLFGTMRQVLLSVVGCFLSIGLPAFIDTGSKYPASEVGRAAVDSLMTGALGVLAVQLMNRIREREELARSMIDTAHEAFISIDQRGVIVEWSLRAQELFGWSADEVVGALLAQTLVPERDRSHYLPGLRRMLDGDPRLLGRRLEVTAARRDGSETPVELTFTALPTSHGVRFNTFVEDISDRRAAEQALHEANQRFRSAFDDAAIGMAIVSLDGRFVRTNRALSELTGYSSEQLTRMGFSDITHPEDASQASASLGPLLEGADDRSLQERRYVHADGHVLWISLSTTIVRDSDGRPLYLLSQMQDVSERKEYEARLAHRALHDELTGLPKRAVLEERMLLAFSRQMRERRPVSVLYLDLDGFKAVNDNFGHDAGDRVLVTIAKRLTALLRPTDVVSRLGGDEFAVFCEGMNEQGATRLAKRIMEVVPRPIEVESRHVTITPSIGIALSRDPSTRPSSLISDADTAMYFAKDEAGTGYAFFEDEMAGRPRSRRPFDTRLNA